MKKVKIKRPDSWFLKFQSYQVYVDTEFAGELSNGSELIVPVHEHTDEVTIRVSLPGGATQEINAILDRPATTIEVISDGYIQRMIPIFVCLIPLLAILLSDLASAKILATSLIVITTIISVYLMLGFKDNWISLSVG